MPVIADANPDQVELAIEWRSGVRQVRRCTSRYQLPACPLRPVERVDVVPVIINSNPEEIKTVLVCHRCIGGSCCAAAWNFTPAGELYVRAGYRRDTKQNKDRKDQSAQSSPWC